MHNSNLEDVAWGMHVAATRARRQALLIGTSPDGRRNATAMGMSAGDKLRSQQRRAKSTTQSERKGRQAVAVASLRLQRPGTMPNKDH
jgi:hypothetical protein